MVRRFLACVAVLVMLVAVAGCGSGNSSDAEPAPVSKEAVVTVTRDRVIATEPVAAAAFSFATDDLCEWVSEDEVAAFVAAEFDWEATATVENGALDEAAECQWELEGTGSANGVVIAGDAGLWQDFDGKIYDLDARMTCAVVIEYYGPVEIGAWVVGHPAVSDGVVVHNGGFGQFAFGVPPDRGWLWLSLNLSASGDWDQGVASEGYEARHFAVANRFLEELGWSSPQG